jgi:hypothetical protein
VRFAVVPWAPEYGSPAGDTVVEPALGDTPVDVAIEVPAEDWAPRPAPSDVELPRSLLFIDGVLRVDGGVWVEGADGVERPGLCGSYAAGAVRCDGQATLAAVEVRHALFTAAAGAAPIQTRHGRFDVCAVAGDDGDQLMLGLQQRMRELEVGVALHAGGEAELIVVDGPLTDRQSVAGAIGYVKTHHARYLPESVGDIVGRLGPGERTPVFLATTKWSRYSWYLRLPGDRGYAWEGVVRCEASRARCTPRMSWRRFRWTSTRRSKNRCKRGDGRWEAPRSSSARPGRRCSAAEFGLPAGGSGGGLTA